MNVDEVIDPEWVRSPYDCTFYSEIQNHEDASTPATGPGSLLPVRCGGDSVGRVRPAWGSAPSPATFPGHAGRIKS